MALCPRLAKQQSEARGTGLLSLASINVALSFSEIPFLPVEASSVYDNVFRWRWISISDAFRSVTSM